LRVRGSTSQSFRQHDFSATVDTNWHHYVLTGNGAGFKAGKFEAYIDGVKQTSPSTKSTAFTFNAIGTGYTNLDFVGQIDELWVFDEVIDQATVTSLMNTNAVPEPSSLALLGLTSVIYSMPIRSDGAPPPAVAKILPPKYNIQLRKWL